MDDGHLFVVTRGEQRPLHKIRGHRRRLVQDRGELDRPRVGVQRAEMTKRECCIIVVACYSVWMKWMSVDVDDDGQDCKHFTSIEALFRTHGFVHRN